MARVRKDVQGAIDRVWPDGIVEMSLGPDESYFSGTSPEAVESPRSNQEWKAVGKAVNDARKELPEG